MARFQFSLRQLLVTIVGAAVALLVIRFALQSHGVAVAALIVVIGATVLLATNAILYAFLRAFGLVVGLDSPPADDAQPPAITVRVPESRSSE